MLDPDGNPEWTELLGGPDTDGVTDIALAEQGLYVTGSVGGQGTVGKLDDTGAVVWTTSLTPPDPDDGASSVASHVLAVGDEVIVTEELELDQGNPTTKTRALDAATGRRRWSSNWTYGEATSVSTDGARVFVTHNAHTVDIGPHISLLTARRLDGHFLWSRTIYPDKEREPDARAVVWADRAVVVASEEDLIAFSPTGRRRWEVPLPDGLDPAGIAYGADYFSGSGLYVGGSTDQALDGANQGGRDAVVGRFVTYQPDARVRVGPDVFGDDRYADRGQRLTIAVAPRHTTEVRFTAQNDGEVDQALLLQGCAGRHGYTVRYRWGTTDLTSELTGDGHLAEGVAPGGVSLIQVSIHAGRRAAARTRCAVVVSSVLTGERDRFTVVVKRS